MILNKQHLRLHKLYTENKLTRAEFRLLISQIGTNAWLDKVILWIFNPFARLKPKKALAFGLVIILFISMLGMLTGFHFSGIPAPADILTEGNKLGFSRILTEHLIQLSVLSIMSYILAKINHIKNIRVLDFFAYFSMAFLARAVFSINLFILKLLSPDFFVTFTQTDKLIHAFPKILVSLWIIFQWLLYIWLYRLYFAALEISSGLSAKRLWICYLFVMIIGNTICYYLSNYLFS